MEQFELVYEGEVASHLICIHCKQRVERGIRNISKHWMYCLENKEGLVIAQTPAEKQLFDNWSINIEK